MNKTLEAFARNELKAGLSQCTDGQQTKFKRMYSQRNMQKTIQEVVEDMPSEKLDWAMSQVENTLAKENKHE